jgi:hypothetical protein
MQAAETGCQQIEKGRIGNDAASSILFHATSR